MNRLADRFAAVVEDFQLDGGWQRRLKSRQYRLDGVHGGDGVGPRLTLDRQHDSPPVHVPTGHLVVFHAVQHRGDLVQPHRRAVAIGDDQRAIGGGGFQLAVGLDGDALAGAVEGSDRLVDVAVPNGLAQFVQTDAARRQPIRVGLHPHREFLGAENPHLGHPGDGGQPLGQHGFGVFVDHRQWQGRRGHGNEKNR